MHRYKNRSDFLTKYIDEMLEKLEETINHKVRLELSTSDKGFQATTFITSLDDEEDTDSEDDVDDDDDSE